MEEEKDEEVRSAAEKFAGSSSDAAAIHDDEVDATSSSFWRRSAQRAALDEQFMTCHELEVGEIDFSFILFSSFSLLLCSKDTSEGKGNQTPS